MHPELAASISAEAERLQIPVPGIKAVIAPHAGYAYSGPAAAWAYGCIDPTHIERVFILGPSHHVYIRQCALSKAQEYATPLGDLAVDQHSMSLRSTPFSVQLVLTPAVGTAIGELRRTRQFVDMSMHEDEDEHSLEMHLPYIRKVFTNPHLQIVPIMVGHVSQAAQASYGKILAPYLADPKTFFVISSDFCHWGVRFDYTYYRPDRRQEAMFLRPFEAVPRGKAQLWQSIRDLDLGGMNAISHGPHEPEAGAGTSPKTAREASEAFAAYLEETENTICGAKPIGVLLAALAELEMSGAVSEARFVRYEQSSQAQTIRDSSVSYASGFVRFLQQA